MKKIFVSFMSLSVVVFFSVQAGAWSHGGRYGGSSLGTAMGPRATTAPGAAAHRTQPGRARLTPAPMAASTSHAYGEGTSHTNMYGGSATHSEGGGWSKTGAYGGTAYGDAHYGGAYYGGGSLPGVPPARRRELLRSRVL